MLTSSIGIISLLNEPDNQLKYFALQKLNKIVDEFWVEISEYVSKLESLQEDPNFKHNDLAALVISKVYYNLGEYEEALSYSLKAGRLFNIDENSEYVTTIISKCLDSYIKLRQAEFGNQTQNIDENIVNLVNNMFQKCIAGGKYKQAIGIALESFRLDIIQKILIESNKDQDLLNYTLKVSLIYIQNLSFLKIILRELVNIYLSHNSPNYISICQCLIFLDDAHSLASIIMKLIKSKNKKDILTAFQISIDAYNCGSQHFLRTTRKHLGLIDNEDKAMNVNVNSDNPAIAEEAVSKDSLMASCKSNKDNLCKLESILTGELPIQLYLHFLIQYNKTDIQILKNSKDSVRNSICHNAVIIAHSFANCGTTNDKFLRNNLEWLAKATNWAKFTATASLGVIHKGHIKDAKTIMSTYLPKEPNNSSGSPYSEGGALYAMGFINAGHGTEVIDYLLQQLSITSSEIIKHGLCLGIGLASLSSARTDIYEILKTNLYQDDAVVGEAAGLAMGLIMVGTNSSQAIDDMISYAKETRHEKIIRGLIIGVGLIAFGNMELAEPLIQTLFNDKDALLRRCAVYVIAMAYCGTGNNSAIQRLLHIAVSDVNDDVRRSAVTCIGFLLIQNPDQCPSIVSLLSESYNPHVRYGSALALGIACAGTNIKEAITMIEPLINDNVNFVRQGALIASALIMVQQNSITQPKSIVMREKYGKIISDKHEEIMVKFGAIIAQGIIDGGGRNATISFRSNKGHLDVSSIIGMLVFTQYWFWYPFSLFLSLSFKPTVLVTLNYDLKMPRMEYISLSKPSTFGYPPPLEVPKNKEKTKVKSVILSYAQKSKPHFHSTKEPLITAGSADDKKMEVDVQRNNKPLAPDDPTVSKFGDATATKNDSNKLPAEASFTMLQNPARVMTEQLKMVGIAEQFKNRYTPLKPLQEGGIIMVLDNDDTNIEPSENDVVPLLTNAKLHNEEEGDEPEPPEPFEYVDA